MKVIDLINDLFDYRGLQPDKLPKKIRFNNNEFVFKDNSYYHENGINIMRYVDHTVDLRVEVEIIEEDKEIEELDIESIKVDYVNNVCNRYDLIEIFGSSINKLRKELNELKKGK